MTNLLDIAELIQRGVGAETVLKLYTPLVERKRSSLLARLDSAKTLEDFLVIQAEARVYRSILSELESMSSEAQSLSEQHGVVLPPPMTLVPSVLVPTATPEPKASGVVADSTTGKKEAEWPKQQSKSRRTRSPRARK